jgi:flagellar motility protein MotE (MotC chaperone)
LEIGMATTKKKPTMTREEAVELYGQMQQTMRSVLQGAGSAEKDKLPPATQQLGNIPAIAKRQRAGLDRGQIAAALLVGACAMVRALVGGAEFAGWGATLPAQATIIKEVGPKYSESELTLLKSLDSRRVELEDRRRRLDDREKDLAEREREFAGRLAQLRELTGMLQADREQGDKKQQAQVGQLANVYGSMNPPEAAALLGQLDITTTLALLERMPEKRMGQILSLMPADRALTITKMLTGRTGDPMAEEVER